MAEDKAHADEFAAEGERPRVPVPNILLGMHVELTGMPTAVTLRSHTGRVVREDEDEDYVIVALDILAQYHHANGEIEDLLEIAVMADNLRVLGR